MFFDQLDEGNKIAKYIIAFDKVVSFAPTWGVAKPTLARSAPGKAVSFAQTPNAKI